MNIKRWQINHLLYLVITISVAFQNVPAQTPDAPQLNQKVEEYMNAAVRVNRFSGTILIARDGKPIVTKSYGMANYELGVPNSAQTVFRIGSLTKQFTAAAIMILQERGKLNVNDGICKYLDDCPPVWQAVTIRHLLTHTSGIISFTNLPDYDEKQSLPTTPASLIGRIRDKPLEFAPGEQYKYNNSGYYLLGVIIERASGKSYDEFVRENILKPLGLENTGYDDNRRIIKNRANGYVVQGDAFFNAAYLDMSVPFSAGALYSTIGDMLRWEQSLYTEKILTRKSLDEMYTPFKNNYGYGWGIRKKFDRQVLEHSGSTNGFNSFISRFPAERVAVIVLSNNDMNFTQNIATDLGAIYFGAPYNLPQERKTISVPSATLDRYVGQYQLPRGVLVITNENGNLFWQPQGRAKTQLFPESETTFFFKENDSQVTFVKDAQGRVTGLIRKLGVGTEINAPKIK